MGAFFFFYSLLYDEPSEKAIKLKEEATQVIKQISSDSSLRIISDNEVNLSRIAELKNLSYDELKSMLRVEGDVCIYLEDEKGNIVILNNTYKGMGSSNINISNTPCNETI